MKLKAKDIRQMKDAEYDNKMKELRKELIKINAQISTRTPPENPGKVKQVKKTIARMLTILHEKKNLDKKTKVKTTQGEVRSKK